MKTRRFEPGEHRVNYIEVKQCLEAFSRKRCKLGGQIVQVIIAVALREYSCDLGFYRMLAYRQFDFCILVEFLQVHSFV